MRRQTRGPVLAGLRAAGVAAPAAARFQALNPQERQLLPDFLGTI